ncbi:hypothetical protein PVAND_011060 [Polypedilum vanderplanki]|uniref:Beta-Casp domain-containing protein n=1 Tax=Polypedilum vanderplanki TaxID=319348 RepID=A0A9J6CI67_POLVA|nr:hypothetical protein PVAND_011060 [Polypedilum vanderplanki]
MKFYCLSNDPVHACYVVTFKELTIMLDCGLVMETVLDFLPLPLVQSSKFSSCPNWNHPRINESQLDGELKKAGSHVFIDSSPEFQPPLEKIIDFSEIDVILISNYMNMLGLPYITEKTNFKGVVYATEPTLQIARLFMEELVDYIETSPKATHAHHWKEFTELHNLNNLNLELSPFKWKKLFSLDDVHKALSRVQIAGFDQKIDIFGALEVCPVSSGYCLGSANWVLSTGLEKICYISGSSTLTTQAKPINQNALKNSDVIIMSGLTQAPHINPDAILGDLCLNVALTLRNNGTVLIPCYPSGVIYDLFEILSQKLDDSGLSTIPMYFISPVAESSLAFSNILAEWLSSTKQNKVYIPDKPFPHANLVKNNRLKFFKHIYSEGFSEEFRQPCVIFCGHPCMRFGDIVHLIEQYGSNPNHTIIFTEPDFPFHQALAPFYPLNMKVVYCPIETTLNFQQANKLIKDLKPETLVIPKVYTHPPAIAANREDLVIDRQIAKQIITFKCGDCIKLPLKRKKNTVFIDPEVARTLIPQEIQNGLKLAPLSGLLDVKDNIYNIYPCDGNVEGVPKQLVNALLKKHVTYEYGSMSSMDIDIFLNKLKQDGFTDVKVTQTSEVDGVLTKIRLVNEEIDIDISEKGTHIMCEGKESWRLKIRDSLLSCMNKF